MQKEEERRGEEEERFKTTSRTITIKTSALVGRQHKEREAHLKTYLLSIAPRRSRRCSRAAAAVANPLLLRLKVAAKRVATCVH